MSRVTLNQKYVRMIKFLRSVKNPRIGRLLAAGGFDNEEYRRGWELFYQAMGPDLPDPQPVTVYDASTRERIDQIDRFENMAFDVADATLRHRYPALHERLFHNIAKANGPEVIFTVGTFLRRLDELEQEGGDEIEEALALLAKRRITPERRRAVQALIVEATTMSRSEADAEEQYAQAEAERRRAEQERLQAEDAMWKWFKDWAQIARTLVTDRRLRYHMGISLRRVSRGGSGNEPMLNSPAAPADSGSASSNGSAPSEPGVPATA